MSFNIKNGEIILTVSLNSPQFDLAEAFALDYMEIHESIINTEYKIPKILLSIVTENFLDLTLIQENKQINITIDNKRTNKINKIETIILNFATENNDSQTFKYVLTLIPLYTNKILNVSTKALKGNILDVLKDISKEINLKLDLNIKDELFSSNQLWCQSNQNFLNYIDYLIERLGTKNGLIFSAYSFEKGLILKDTLAFTLDNNRKNFVTQKIKDNDIRVKESSVFTFLKETFEDTYHNYLVENNIINSSLSVTDIDKNKGKLLNLKEYINEDKNNIRQIGYKIIDSKSIFEDTFKVIETNKQKRYSFNVGQEVVLSDSEYVNDLNLLDTVYLKDVKFEKGQNKQTSCLYFISDIIIKFVSYDYLQSYRLLTNSLNNIL